jgi:hypothetical protein
VTRGSKSREGILFGIGMKCAKEENKKARRRGGRFRVFLLRVPNRKYVLESVVCLKRQWQLCDM